MVFITRALSTDTPRGQERLHCVAWWELSKAWGFLEDLGWWDIPRFFFVVKFRNMDKLKTYIIEYFHVYLYISLYMWRFCIYTCFPFRMRDFHCLDRLPDYSSMIYQAKHGFTITSFFLSWNTWLPICRFTFSETSCDDFIDRYFIHVYFGFKFFGATKHVDVKALVQSLWVCSFSNHLDQKNRNVFLKTRLREKKP